MPATTATRPKMATANFFRLKRLGLPIRRIGDMTMKEMISTPATIKIVPKVLVDIQSSCCLSSDSQNDPAPEVHHP